MLHCEAAQCGGSAHALSCNHYLQSNNRVKCKTFETAAVSYISRIGADDDGGA